MIGDTTKDVLVPVLIDGTAGAPLAVICDRPPGSGENGATVLVRRALGTSSADELSADLAEGADGVLATGFAAAADLERLSARLAVAEALAGRPAGSATVVVLVDRPSLVPVLLQIAERRLSGLGLDTAALAESIGLPFGATRGAALDHARGAVVIAAAAAGVPAFERLAAPPAEGRLSAIRADGFAWAMMPLVES